MTIEELGEITSNIERVTYEVENAAGNIKDGLKSMRKLKDLYISFFDAIDSDEELLNEFIRRCEED